nr:RNA-directed DNA polymerase, eukaryota, reverse transcriptase zinc-binding domain protein [Tanacetum cinerariifolium]
MARRVSFSQTSPQPLYFTNNINNNLNKHVHEHEKPMYKVTSTTSFSPMRFLGRIKAKFAKALGYVSSSNSRKITSSPSPSSSVASSSCNGLERSRSYVETFDSNRAQAIEDCIKFLNSNSCASSNFQRSKLLENNEFSTDGILVMMGDFNEVREASERHGSIFKERHAEIFNTFISNSSLIDIPLGGYNFTWTDKWGSKMSKLDWFLVSDAFLNMFSHAVGVVLEKGLPDHRPILLKESEVDYGPTPFRFFHSWLEMDGFHNLVINTWKNYGIVEANGLVSFKKNLQNLINVIREWIALKRSESNKIKKDHQLRLSFIDVKIDQGSATQKANIKWALEGDENSSFFHSSLKRKWRNLSIIGILKNGDWIEDPNCVKTKFLSHFSNTFQYSSESSLSFEADMHNHLSLAQYGPLILNEDMAWYRKQMNELMVFKVDFEKAFDSLLWDYLDLVLEKLGCNMARVSNWNTIVQRFSSKLSQWKARLLSVGGRLSLIKYVLGNLPTDRDNLERRVNLDEIKEAIWDCGSSKAPCLDGYTFAFDGILVMMGDFNEVREASERHGSIFKERHAEIFNTFISNSSLIDIPLGGYNFTWTDKWGSKMSKLDWFLVSDAFLNMFSHAVGVVLEKGLPDHRPILLKESEVDYGPTPFRFFHSWLEMDGFHNLVINTWKNYGIVEANGLVSFKKNLQNLINVIREWIALKRSESNKIKKDHQLRLSFIDVKIDQGSATQKANIKWALEGDENSSFFHSSLKRKWRNLSIIGILKNGDWIEDPNCVKTKFLSHFSNTFQYSSESSLSFEADMHNHLSLAQYGPLILNEDMAWYRKQMNELMVFKVDFEKAFDSLLWDYLDLVLEKLGCNMARVSNWNTIVQRFSSKLSQWKARLLSELESMRNKFFIGGDEGEKKFTWVKWKKCLASKKLGYEGNGTSTRFWDDIWCRESTLKSKFSRVYMLDNDRDCVVANRMHLVDWSSVLRRLPRGGVESSQFNSMLSSFGTVELSDKPDSWSWFLYISAGFSVSSVRSFIDANTLDVDTTASRWNRCILIKVNVFLWRLMLNRLPSLVNLNMKILMLALFYVLSVAKTLKLLTMYFFL